MGFILSKSKEIVYRRRKYSDVKAVTPGQACVIYLGEQCLMGGIIKQVFKDGKDIWYLK